ncbi:folylpolyglutamate synthase/dihydrofolate synthase family protein [Flavihumibacter cheonanensis]|jgi:dihydrofolate synthase/folylpolyglutamate synthase|uniref:bifunctional folylpolyglutamate synthase/dihydrofolate synthase n=1 Tax=Flavihumibacter cheonanensis TaxID=1442385 RepID=UPI001EF811DB|nr:folylpolyglutamate synthase/dihydrofolate synthase family protein [Flavihumibacter cheonanensis]MCG7751214.1 bifunctional folylpolyglutamate synthase/dihydrofolate synthase [Flavihumibacter cheonanensis]
MNYAETIDFLYTRLPMFSKQGAGALKKDLHNIKALEQANGNPHTKFKSIHIAGTNGKGSTSHMLAAILQKAGYKTGLYTSPHLKDFRERIRINGHMIPEQRVIELTEDYIPLMDAIEPSFFEITVAMAFQWFAEEKIDIAVIETGLGGRLDSTNIILPELSVITNIGWDHMHILGSDLPTIASEKAGIIKPGIPVVIGEVLPETRPVFEQVAQANQAKIHFAEEDQELIEWNFSNHHLQVTVRHRNALDALHLELDLPGYYQLKNIRTVLQAVELLKQLDWKIPADVVREALRHVKKLTGLHGRWELIDQSPDLVLDVAHNEDGIRAILKQLELCNFHHLHLVIGMVKDKDVAKVLSLLPHTASYYFTQAQIPRAMPVEELRIKAAGFQLTGNAYPNVNLAITAAKAAADKRDLILVCGSVFVIGEVNR